MNGGKGFQVNYGDVNLSGVVYVDTDKKAVITSLISTQRNYPVILKGIFSSYDYLNFIGTGIYMDNLLGFRRPYKVERWNGSAWEDVTNTANWAYLTDNKPQSYIHLIPTFNYTPEDVSLRFYYSFESPWVSPASYFTLRLHHVTWVKGVKIEAANDENITSDYWVLLNYKKPLVVYDGTLVFPTKTFSSRTYLRITLNFSIDYSLPYSSQNLVFLEMSYYSHAFWPRAKLLGSIIPIDWNYEKKVFFFNNVGINTTDPQSRLHINSYNGDSYIILEQSQENSAWSLGLADYLPSQEEFVISRGYTLQSSPYFVITPSGNVGIGNSTPSYKLQVGNPGDGTSAIANAWNTFSDVRFKEDITNITNALSLVERLRGVRFRWKNTSREDIGLVAQEVENIIPEVVYEDANGYKSVAYDKLVAVLIEAIKEQQKIINKQEKEIKALQKELGLLNQSCSQ